MVFFKRFEDADMSYAPCPPAAQYQSDFRPFDLFRENDVMPGARIIHKSRMNGYSALAIKG